MLHFSGCLVLGSEIGFVPINENKTEEKFLLGFCVLKYFDEDSILKKNVKTRKET
jgi:hypothetical protein